MRKISLVMIGRPGKPDLPYRLVQTIVAASSLSTYSVSIFIRPLQFDITMKTGIRPISDSFQQTVLKWVDMDVIDMPDEIVLLDNPMHS